MGFFVYSLLVMALISENQFVGRLKISQNDKQTADLSDVIDYVQKDVLTGLLGAAEYNRLIADLVNNVPQGNKWKALVNGETYTDLDGVQQNYNGVLELLKKFAYYDYYNDRVYQNTSSGKRALNAENSVVTSRQQQNAEIEPKYNEAVDDYKASYKWMCAIDEQAVLCDGETDNGGGQYEFNTTTEALYLDVADTIQINGYTFLVDQVDPSSIVATEINNTTGLTFGDGSGNFTVEYNVFPDLDHKDKRYSIMDGFL